MKKDDESCRCCGSLADDAEHAIFVCARWGVAREAVCQPLGVYPTLDTMVPPMLQSEGVWKYIGSFSTLLVRIKDLDGRFGSDEQVRVRGRGSRANGRRKFVHDFKPVTVAIEV